MQIDSGVIGVIVGVVVMADTSAPGLSYPGSKGAGSGIGFELSPTSSGT